MGVSVVMRTFGWILSVLLLVSIVSSCPINQTSLSSHMDIVGGVCDDVVIYLYDLSTKVPVETLNISGDLTITNSKLITLNGTSPEINLFGGSFLNLTDVNLTSSAGDGYKVIFNGMSGSRFLLNNMYGDDNLSLVMIFSDADVEIDGIFSLNHGLIYSKFVFLSVNDSRISNLRLPLDYFRLNLSANASFSDIYMHNFPNSDFDITDSSNISLTNLGGVYTPYYNLSLSNSTVNSINNGGKLRYILKLNSSLNLFNSNDSRYELNDNSTLSNYFGVNFLTRRAIIGSPLSSVVINAFDVFNLTVPKVTGISDLDGNYFTYLKEYVRNSTYVNYSSNYTINSIKVNYLPFSFEHNLTSSSPIIIDLNTAKGIIRSGSACTVGISTDFCVDANPKSAPDCKSMVSGETCEVSFIINATDNLGSGSYTLNGRNFSFFAISESDLLQVPSIESGRFNITVVP